MFVLSRRFFSAEAVKEVEKAAAEAAKQLQKDYTTQCSTVMKVRGHHKIALNTVKSKNGQEMRFDFSYGWPFRYYCKCNPSTEPVTKEMIQSFEVSSLFLHSFVEGVEGCRCKSCIWCVFFKGCF